MIETPAVALIERRSWLRRTLSSVWFKLVVATSVIGLLFYFNRVDVTALASLSRSWPWLLAAFLLMLPPFLIVSYRFKVILGAQSIEVPFRQALRWTMVGSFFDLAMPGSSGGDVVKAGYVFDHVGSGRRMRAVMAVAFDRIIGLFGLFCLVAVVTVIGWPMLQDLPARRLIVAVSLAAGIGPLIVFRIAGARRLYYNQRVNRLFSSYAWGERLKELIASFNALRERPQILLAALGLSILNHVFWCASLIMISIAVGNAVPVLKGFVVFPLAIFGNIFGVAGGFGVGTAAFDLLLSRLLSIQNGALIGLLFQVLQALCRLGGLPFYLASASYIHSDHVQERSETEPSS